MKAQNVSARKRLISTAAKLSILVVIGGGVFIFQNCSQPADGLSQEDALLEQSNTMGFAYDATIDQIAYMSCPLLTSGYDTNTYFTLRAGAYGTGGLKFTDAFYSGFGHRSADLMAQMVSESTANSNTVLQLAIRSAANLDQLVTATGTATQGGDFVNLLDTLGTTNMSELLIANGYNSTTYAPTELRTKIMREGNGTGTRVEGTLQMSPSEAVASDIRSNYLSTGSAMLALTYVEPSSGSSGVATNARTPATAFPTTQTSTSSQAYGTGYHISFGMPQGNGVQSPVGFLQTSGTSTIQSQPYPSNIMTGIQEVSLLTANTSASSASWVCPQDLRFKIVRSSLDVVASGTAPSVGGIACNRVPDPAVLSGDLAIARNSLRVEDWWIDMANNCIMPKNDVAPNCYGSLNYVNYDYTNPTIGCDPNSSSASSSSSSSSTTSSGTTVTTTTTGNSLTNPICLAWVSICYRTSGN